VYGNKGSELFYFGARYYDAELGVWGSTDPKDQLYYAYGYATNPISFIDPDGQYIVGAIVGAVVGAYIGGAISSGSFNPGKWQESDWISAINGASAGLSVGSSIENGVINAYANAHGGVNSAYGARALIQHYGGISGLNSRAAARKLAREKDMMSMMNAMYCENSLYEIPISPLNSDVAPTFVFTPEGTKITFPDADGYITLDEANYWFRNGKGKRLYADLGKIDFNKIKTTDFPGGVGSSRSFNLFSPRFKSKDGLVYGTLNLRLGANNTVTSVSDFYDFDIQPGRFWRNQATRIGHAYAGRGIPFRIQFYGVGRIVK
jgi:hypothetical protein